jgi:hypothetical protein
MIIFQRQTKNAPTYRMLSECFEIDAACDLDIETKYKNGSLTLDNNDETTVKYAIRPISATTVKFDPELFEWIDLSFNVSTNVHRVLATSDGPRWENSDSDSNDPPVDTEHEVILTSQSEDLARCKKHIKDYASDIDSDVEDGRVKERQIQQSKLDRLTEITRLQAVQADAAAQLSLMEAETSTTNGGRINDGGPAKTNTSGRKPRRPKRAQNDLGDKSDDANGPTHSKDVDSRSDQSNDQGNRGRNRFNRRAAANSPRGRGRGGFGTGANSSYRSNFNRHGDDEEDGSTSFRRQNHLNRRDYRRRLDSRSPPRDRKRSRSPLVAKNSKESTSTKSTATTANSDATTAPLPGLNQLLAQLTNQSNAGPFVPIIPNNSFPGWDPTTCWMSGWTPAQMPPPALSQLPSSTQWPIQMPPASLPNWNSEPASFLQRRIQLQAQSLSQPQWAQPNPLLNPPPSDWQQMCALMAKPNLRLLMEQMNPASHAPDPTRGQQLQPAHGLLQHHRPPHVPQASLASLPLTAQPPPQPFWQPTWAPPTGANQPLDWTLEQAQAINTHGSRPLVEPPPNQDGNNFAVFAGLNGNIQGPNPGLTPETAASTFASGDGAPGTSPSTVLMEALHAGHNSSSATLPPLPQRAQFQSTPAQINQTRRPPLLPTPGTTAGTTAPTGNQQPAMIDAFKLAWQHFNASAQQQNNSGEKRSG